MSLFVNIEKKIGEFHLRVSFYTKSKQIFGLLGESGCGKSMTLKCIAGIETPDRGKIILDGRVLYDSSLKINLPPQQRKVGYLFQDYALFPNMTVEENISIVAKEKKETESFIQKFCLEGLEKHYPSMLSGGQKQRCALARMMASKPELILLDEPFSALDKNLKWHLELQILELLDGMDCPAVFVSHNKEEIDHLCDTVGIMFHGSLMEAGTKKEVFKQPHFAATAKLVGCENVFHKNDLEHLMNLSLGDYQYLGIPQEALSLTRYKQSVDLKGRIERILEEKEESVLIVRLEKKRLYFHLKGSSSFHEGDSVDFKIDRDKLYYLY